jgi:hypothetical protein
MKSCELPYLRFPPLRRTARNGALLCLVAICGAWTTMHVFTARGTHDLAMSEAMQALAGPLSDAQRKTAVAAVRRQACLAAVALVEESKADTPAGREAAAALDHLREVLR